MPPKKRKNIDKNIDKIDIPPIKHISDKISPRKTPNTNRKPVNSSVSRKSVVGTHTDETKNDQISRNVTKNIDTRSIEYIEDRVDSINKQLKTNGQHIKPVSFDHTDAKGVKDPNEPHNCEKTHSEYFFDSKKNKIKIWPIMMDQTTNDVLVLYTNKPCKNCHHSYDTHPIGCPIKYIPHHPDSNDPKRKKIEKFLNDHNFSYDSTDYFEVEHLFCSFPCTKSYIMNKLSIAPSSYRYTNALTYLSLLYKKLFSLKVATIIPSAHNIDSLLVYGGHLSITEYRNTIGILQFDKLVTTKRPIMFASFSYMEETAARTEKDYM